MIGNLMARGTDRFDFGGKFRGAFADDKEGRPRSIALQDFEHARRVQRVRSIVDREPNFASLRFEIGDYRSPPLAVRDQRRIQDQQM